MILVVDNSSLSSGLVPIGFKHATVQPPLKKPGHDQTVLVDFRPISKPLCISKASKEMHL